MEFQKDFCPGHSDAAAINTLESTVYYQKLRSVDDYLDEFLELVSEAGYTDPRTIVVKFRKGLDPQIQNSIATMPYGRPLDTSPDNWYKAAKTIDQNCQANEAFQSASRPTPRPISRPASATLVKINPAPVRGPNGSFENQTGRTINSSRTTEDKRRGSKTTCV